MSSPAKIEWLPIAQILPNQDNPRHISDDKFQQLVQSIKDMPEMLTARPLVVNQDNVVLGGNMRLKALQEVGAEEVPVMRVDWPEDKQRAFIIKDNVSYGEWDWDVLANEWDAKELEDWGMDVWQNTDEEPGLTDPNEVPSVTASEPDANTGDIWQLGEHKLMCGSATALTDLDRLMDGELADLWLTDPPYNVDYEGGTGLKLKNDNMGDAQFLQFLTDAYRNANTYMRAGASFYIWHADSEGYNFRKAALDIGWQIRQCLIWQKNSLVLGRQDYQWIHEPCLYGWKGGAAHYFVDKRTLTTVQENTETLRADDLKGMTKQELVDTCATILGLKQTLIHYDRPTRSKEHPTMKPVELWSDLMSNSSTANQIVLDTFAGSGVTIIAAEQLGRKARCMELDPKYCDVIIKRWEDYTGKKATLINRTLPDADT